MIAPQNLIHGYPLDYKNPKNFSFEQYMQKLKEDSYFAYRVFFPNSPPLFPFQVATFRALDLYDFVWIQAPRGISKTFSVGCWAAATGMTNKVRFIYAGPTYRQSKKGFLYAKTAIEQNCNPDDFMDLSCEINGNITEGSMESKIRLYNGTEHIALPMGNGKTLRGDRANVLIIDEFFLMEKEMVEMHIMPFLQGHKDKSSIGPKMIVMTSAEYQDCYAYSVLSKKWVPKIIKEDGLVSEDPEYKRKYFIVDIQVEDAEKQGYDVNWEVLEQQLSGCTNDEKEQALHNKWVGTSGYFLPSNLIERMQSPDINIEFEGERGAEYFLSVDVSTTASLTDGDLFVVHVWKCIPERRAGIVYSVSRRGLTDNEMAREIHQLNEKFNVEYIVSDKGGGGFSLANALMLPKLIFTDGTEFIPRQPILLHNENRALPGERKLVFNKSSDELVAAGFSDERSRAGENFRGEDVMTHMMYDGLRKRLSEPSCPLLIPATCNPTNMVDGVSEEEVYENIKESVMQLKLLHMRTHTTGEGHKEPTLSKNRVPLYDWSYGVHDRASALAYGYIGYKIYYRYGTNNIQPADPRAVPSRAPNIPREFIGRIEIKPNEIYRPFG